MINIAIGFGLGLFTALMFFKFFLRFSVKLLKAGDMDTLTGLKIQQARQCEYWLRKDGFNDAADVLAKNAAKRYGKLIDDIRDNF